MFKIYVPKSLSSVLAAPTKPWKLKRMESVFFSLNIGLKSNPKIEILNSDFQISLSITYLNRYCQNSFLNTNKVTI